MYRRIYIRDDIAQELIIQSDNVVSIQDVQRAIEDQTDEIIHINQVRRITDRLYKEGRLPYKPASNVKMIPIKCKHCYKTFTPRSKNGVKYCGRVCRQRAYERRHGYAKGRTTSATIP